MINRSLKTAALLATACALVSRAGLGQDEQARAAALARKDWVPEAKAENAAAEASPTTSDASAAAGYIPGYRGYVGVGMAPFVPRAGALPGGVTPSFGSPTPTQEWAFNFTGYASASLRAGINHRDNPRSGQSSLVLHAQPETVDLYGSFQSVNAVPGNWVGLRFQYGNKYVTSTVSFDTYNPSRASSYTQIGSQFFLNDAFLSFRVPPLGKLQLSASVGYFTTAYYGNLGQYGSGLYGLAMIGNPRGVGETLSGEYELGKNVSLFVEDGLMTSPKTGKAPNGALNTASTAYADATVPATWAHHVHVGVQRRGDVTVQATAHLMTLFTQSDEAAPAVADNPDTPQWDESAPRDGRIHVAGIDVRAVSQAFGYLGLGAAYIDAKSSYRIRGMNTYAGDGASLSSDWLGPSARGNGRVLVAGINYRFSVASMLWAPKPFDGNAPDLWLETAFHVASVASDDPAFDGRLRHKYGVDGLYRALSWFGLGLHVARVAPNSNDSQESFSVLAPRLEFRSGWQSHETVTLKYVKWFYGKHTHGDGWEQRPREQLDEQMLGLNFGMWW